MHCVCFGQDTGGKEAGGAPLAALGVNAGPEALSNYISLAYLSLWLTVGSHSSFGDRLRAAKEECVSALCLV